MTTASEIRVLLVEDSPTVRRYLVELIEEAPGLVVVGQARDGDEALEMVRDLQPDVVSMDLQMPHTDGLQATRNIMAQYPTPIVVVSQLLEHDVALSMDALGAGALAVVSKPPNRTHPNFPAAQRTLLTNLRAMAGVKVVSRRRRHEVPTPSPSLSIKRAPEVLGIAASTGGPRALREILRALPADFSVPIVIAQHMPPEFMPGLVRWLDESSGLQVRLAQEGDSLEAGTVLVAPGDAQLEIIRGTSTLRIQLRPQKQAERFCPSADVLFSTLSVACGSQAIGVILTGMGSDGAEGLLALRKAGGCTIAQNEESSTVYGMPRAAIARGAAQHVISLAQIPSKIWDLL